MFNNSSNLPCRNHIITVLGKSEVYSAKLTSLFSWILVCKNIKTVIYKIKLASECFTNQPCCCPGELGMVQGYLHYFIPVFY